MIGHHPAPDSTQFSFGGMSLSSLGMGVVVAIFSLVGFESSTAFGEESVNPLKTIPRSIIWSLVLTGAFFIFVSYAEVLGTHGYKDSLDKIDAPLNVLADTYGVSFLSPAALGRRDVQLLRAGVVVHERRRARHVRDGSPPVLPPAPRASPTRCTGHRTSRSRSWRS